MHTLRLVALVASLTAGLTAVACSTPPPPPTADEPEPEVPAEHTPFDAPGMTPTEEPAAAACPIPGCDAVTPDPDADLLGVWIAPGGDVWAVGEHGLAGRRGRGGGWCWCAPGPDAPLTAVWGTADDDVWMVGDGGAVLHFDGDGFETLDAGTTDRLEDIWGSSKEDVFAVGANGTVRHFDGGAWTAADLAPEHQLLGVWGASADAVWAVGRVPYQYDELRTGSEAEIHRFDRATGTWTREASFLMEYGAAAFDGISGSGPNDVWAVGNRFPAGAAAGFAFAAHFDGTRWTGADEAPEEVRIHRNYSDVVIPPPGAGSGAWITAAGSGSAVRVDQGAWSEDAAMTTQLRSVDARGTLAWSVGNDGKILRWTGTSWVSDASLP